CYCSRKIVTVHASVREAVHCSRKTVLLFITPFRETLHQFKTVLQQFVKQCTIHAKQCYCSHNSATCYCSRQTVTIQAFLHVLTFPFTPFHYYEPNKMIIDLDSNNWVVDEFGASDMFNQLVPTMLWNTVMDTMMKEIHAGGKTMQDIEQVLKWAPVIPGVVPAIKAAHALGCDLKIVSDANLFFVETILEHSGIKDCFSEINTNPSYIDDEGKLRICPYHDFDHKCKYPCPPNMCKGLVIERMQAVSLAMEGNNNKKRMIYLGDEAGDFCPSLMLREQDFVMPRKDFPVWKLMNENCQLIKAKIHGWTDGEE
ncbi:inorganic pyrophosphatase 2-like, partial [Capsicum annuum]|uniref:inorganic pyrophosphatase 2-like n=1 Tax=Capsicum annuum TaxID=4072 RepID=UPI001FB04BCC